MKDVSIIEQSSIYRGKVVDLSLDRVELPNGEVADLEVIRHPGAAAIVPVDDEGLVWLVRQYRYATDNWLLEVPAGKLDGGETPESCAARELEEEIGKRASSLSALGWIWTTPGFTNERIHLFLARALVASEQSLETDEVLSIETMPFDEAIERVHRGEICDSKSVCALLRADRQLRDEGRV